MKTTVLARLLLASLPVFWACSSDSNNGGGTGGAGGSSGAGGRGGSSGSGGSAAGSGGSAAGSGGSSAGSGGSTAGSGGSSGSGGSAGGSGGSGGGTADTGPAAPGCGMGRKAATGPTLDTFDGMSQVLEWRVAYKGMYAGMKITPTGSLQVTVLGEETHAVGDLALYGATERPCFDASAYTGIQFKVSGTVNKLLFRLTTPATIPVAEGGICMSDTLCAYAHYQKDITASVAAGGTVKVAFAEMMAPYGSPAPFEKNSIIGLLFLTLDTDKTHTFTIDDITLY
jgi:hypothetical protein